MLDNLVAFSLALFAALLLTPWIAKLAQRLKAVDFPDGHRKSHLLAVPLGGGVVVAMAAAASLVAMFWMLPVTLDSTPAWLLRGLLPAAVILMLVGIVDDTLSLTGIYKLIGQVFAASLMVAAGSRFECLSLFGYEFPLGDFCIPFSVFFCLGAINAFNLIDGADALASSIGAVVCLTLGMIAAAQGQMHAALVCFALVGALVGFLRYNLPPAQIYLGDTGSMLIGLVVATVAIECSIKRQAAFALAVPLAICAIPILDVIAALIRRVTTGQSVFAADRGHLHHVLLVRGWTVMRTVIFITGLTALTCGAALVSYFSNQDVFALLIVGGVFVTLAVTRVFGHSEVALIASHSKRVVRRLTKRAISSSVATQESSIQLQGQRNWQNIWTGLRESMPRFHVVSLSMHLNIPQLQEAFFANWNDDNCSATDRWLLAIPIKCEEHVIGKLSLQGASHGHQALDDMQELLGLLGTLDWQIKSMMDAPPTPFVAPKVATARNSKPQLVSSN